MTDTTDIKALSERLRALAKTATPGKWWIDSHGEALVAFTDDGIETVLKPEHLREKAHRDENTGSLSYWPNDSDASWIASAQPQNIIALLDHLEAERQRADAVCCDIRIQANDLKSAQTVNKVLQAELAALEGDEVPVAWIRERAIDKPEHKGKVWRDISYPVKPEPAAVDGVYHDVIIPLYDRPQKPVVLPDYRNADFYSHDCTEFDPLGYWIAVKAAIKAAGGIVKDGE